MNKRQKEVLENSLENEKQVLRLLEENYIQALKDIQIKIKDLMDSEETQSKIYQINYQKSLEKQIKTILDILQENNITTIQEYLQSCYENTFIGALYDIQGQGIPLTVPINQKQVVNIINTPVGDLKLSERIYENTSKLKEVLKSEIARGISNNYSYWIIARNISHIGQIDLYKAQRIARTEGHRVQEESRYEAQKQAKNKGADIVKQWDSTLDSRTRESHRKLDGQIKELDEPFEIDGHKAMYPGKFGRPEEDINCRCVSLQRAKWALDESELEVLKERAAYFGLDKIKNFEEFKTKYLGINSDIDINKGYTLSKTSKQFGKKIGKHAKDYGLNPGSVEDRVKMNNIIDNIVNNYSEVRFGDWRGQNEDVLFFIKEKDVVVTKQDGEFITILKGGVENVRVKNAGKRKI